MPDKEAQRIVNDSTLAVSGETLDTSPYVEFGERHLSFREDTPYEVWSEVVKRLKSAEKSIQWWLGDALRFGERRYGEMYSQALEETDFSYGALRNAAWVAGRIEMSRRHDNLSFSHHQEVASLEPEEQDLLLTAAKPEAGESKPRLSTRDLRDKVSEIKTLPPEVAKNVHFMSDTDEWYTPERVVKKVVGVLGDLDLDPCADPGKGIPAKAHLTKVEDGLKYEWSGVVYMNPPYGREILPWVEKLKKHHESGDVPTAIALLPARTDTEWFALLDGYPRCFVRGRLKFSGGKNSAPFPSAAVYLGNEKERFVEAFASLGTIFERVGA